MANFNSCLFNFTFGVKQILSAPVSFSKGVSVPMPAAGKEALEEACGPGAKELVMKQNRPKQIAFES